MKTHPFNQESVRATMDGRKTRFSLPVKDVGLIRWCPIVVNGHGGWTDEHGKPLKPKFNEGDIVGIKEAWGKPWHHAQPPYFYKADDEGLDKEFDFDGWQSPFTMPRLAIRLFIEILSVKAERLQEISEEDAIAEGIEIEPVKGYNALNPPDPKFMGKKYDYPKGFKGRHSTMLTPIESYKSLLNATKGPDFWNANPWCFVYAFRVVEKGEGG